MLKIKIHYKHILIICLLAIMIMPFCGGSKSSKTDKPHILLITIDTLRRDHLGVYGYPRNTSPFIDSLARKGTMFKHVFTPIPNTASSHATILTALHPLTHNVTSNANPLTEKVQTVAEVMKKNGYHTIGATSVTFLSEDYNFNQGFEDFSDKWDTSKKGDDDFQRIAENTNNSLFTQIENYLKKGKEKPLFIWVHYYDPHTLYHNWKHISFKNKLPKWEDDKLMRRYDKEIRYTDDHIRALYEMLEKKGIAKKLITCITADHGEQFHDHGGSYYHADIYSENTLVPLIFHGNGIPGGKVVDDYISTMDIAPTLLGRSHLKFDYPVDGINLMKEGEFRDTYPKRKFFIIGNDKYTRSLNMVDAPLSFILNFDNHYKNWYVKYGNSSLPSGGFAPINKRWFKKTKGNIITFRLPYKSERGRNFFAVRGNIKTNNGLELQVKMLQNSLTKKINVPKDAKEFEILYPVSIRDKIMINLFPSEGTVIDTGSLSYAFIKGKDFPGTQGFDIHENYIHEKLYTLRKDIDGDEIYDLSKDVHMVTNLAQDGKYPRQMVEFRKLIYLAYRHFLKKQQKLMKGVIQKEEYSEKEKEMLKSLGYL